MTPLTTPERIMSQKMALCIDEVFFGVLLMGLKVVEAQPGEMLCDTMETDGKTLWWCDKYVAPLTDDFLKGLLAHEVMHNASLHHIRRGNRDPKRWNIACDAAVDHLLHEAGFQVPDNFALMPDWDWAKGLSAEQIYHDMPNHPPPPGGGGGKPRPGTTVDAPAGEDPSTLEAEMKITIKQAAMMQQSADRRKGKETGWLSGFIDSVCEPKVPYSELLKKFFSPLIPSDTTWARPNRRFVHAGLYLPGQLKDGIGEGIVFFDSSGSCMQDWPQFRGDLEYIFNQVRPERVHVIMCDSSVKGVQTYEQGEEFIPNVMGGGGSDFRPAFALVEEMGLRPEWAIVLSDMHIDFPSTAPNYPVIAVSTTSTSGPAWAENIFMDRAE